MTQQLATPVAGFASTIREQVARVVVGQEAVVERILISLLTGGHLLLQGYPGLAKTLLVNAVARSIDLHFARVQFTIDLLPGDILGGEILDQARGCMRVERGPIFTNLLLADEINRASPKVQSALLEAMQERVVTLAGEPHPLPTPFLVIATQNPVEQAGTFDLPEAQLDRFLLCHRLCYPSATEEAEVLRRTLGLGLNRRDGGAVPQTAFDLIDAEDPLPRAALSEAMAAVQTVHVSPVFQEHCLALVRATREDPRLELGASPRASIALATASRARAFLHDRDHVLPEDLHALAADVLLHRLRPSYEALAEGADAACVLDDIRSRLG